MIPETLPHIYDNIIQNTHDPKIVNHTADSSSDPIVAKTTDVMSSVMPSAEQYIVGKTSTKLITTKTSNAMLKDLISSAPEAISNPISVKATNSILATTRINTNSISKPIGAKTSNTMLKDLTNSIPEPNSKPIAAKTTDNVLDTSKINTNNAHNPIATKTSNTMLKDLTNLISEANSKPIAAKTTDVMSSVMPSAEQYIVGKTSTKLIATKTSNTMLKDLTNSIPEPKAKPIAAKTGNATGVIKTQTGYGYSYECIKCKTALADISKSHLPFSWDLNVYRGCSHSCRYCYALYSHRYLNSQNYFGQLYAKENIAECLDKQLSRPSWQRAVINLGGVTDSYQPLEAQCRLMPEVLKVLIKHRNPVTLSTKSALVLRDLDLFARLAEVAAVNIAVTVTSIEPEIQNFLEPYSSKPKARLAALAAFKNTKVVTGVHMMPIVPYLSDGDYNLETIIHLAKEAHASYIIACSLNLRGPTKQMFLGSLQEHFPDIYTQLKLMYRGAYAPKEYRIELSRRINALRRKYHFYPSFADFNPLLRCPPLPASNPIPEQLSLL